ncbi:hypothetical protein D3C85_101370 [compost metagenome]
MRKYDFFIQSMKAKVHYNRAWILRAFSVVIDDVKNGDLQWGLKHTKENVQVYVPDGDGKWSWQVLQDAKPYEIPFIYHDSCGPIKAGDVENLNKDLPDGTWGDLLFNSRVLVYAGGTLFEYAEGPINLGGLERFIIGAMVDNEVPEKPGVIYVRHYLRFGKAVSDLAGYEMFVPSVTEHALQPSPNRDKILKEMLELYKDQLDDPVIQARIQDALVKDYSDNLKGDPSEGFLYKRKSLNTALKRMFQIHGPEAGFEEGGRATLVTTSLQEGLDVTKFPHMVNSLRAGSYFRGAMTALAGEDVDLMGRIFQNARVVKGFCGTTDQLDIKVSEDLIGRTIVDGKESVKLSAENIGQYLGKVYPMFSPAFCITPRTDCCEVCFGDKLSAYPDSIGSMVGEIPSTMMAVMMGSAHAKELKTTPLFLETFLRN